MVTNQKDFRDDIAKADAMAQAAKDLASTVDNTIKSAAIVFEANVSITRSSFLTVVLAPQEITFDVPLAKVGDIIFVHRAGKVTNGSGANPAVVVGGVSLESTGFVPQDGKVTVYYSMPTLTVALGSTLTIPLRMRGFRSA